MSDPVQWEIGDLDAANSLLRREHYLGPIRQARHVLLGVADGQTVAAQVWKLPTSRRLPNDGTWLELARWCLTPAAGANAGSRQHRAAVALLRPVGVSVLVSYSDPSVGHTGALYRACNWRWFPTWHRLRTPPTANGAWQAGKVQAVKDRWTYLVDRRQRVPAELLLDDPGAIRYWQRHATASELAWARGHPQLDPMRWARAGDGRMTLDRIADTA